MAALASAGPPGLAMESRLLYDSQRLQGWKAAAVWFIHCATVCVSFGLPYEACVRRLVFCLVKLAQIHHPVCLDSMLLG